MSSSPLSPRLALIGISGYGIIYLNLAKAARARGEVTITAAVIINPEEEAANEADLRAHGTRIYRDYEEMLRAEKGRIDLCLIPTGIPWHARMTIAALEAGANVLVEKPLAGSLAEVAAIRAAEKAAGKFVAVGFQDIYSPINHWLKHALTQGAIGEIKAMRFLGLWPRPASYFTRNPWAGRLHAHGAQVLDSPLNNAFAHFVNLCLYLADDSAVQVESAELLRAHNIESFDTSVVLARSANGIRYWFGATHCCEQVLEPEIHIEGSAGRVEWKHERSCVIFRGDGSREERALPETAVPRQEMFDACIKKLHEPSTPVCTTAIAERHTALVEAVHAAARVQSVPAKLVSWKSPGANSAPVPVIAGLEAALLRAFASRQLLRDAGFALESSGNA